MDRGDFSLQPDDQESDPGRSQIMRAVLWGGVACVALAGVVLAAKFQNGSLQTATASIQEPPQLQAQVKVAETPYVSTSKPVVLDDIELETRRLADIIHKIQSEQKGLVNRINDLEQAYGDITATIRSAPQVQAQPPATVPAAAPVAVTTPQPQPAQPQERKAGVVADKSLSLSKSPPQELTPVAPPARTASTEASGKSSSLVQQQIASAPPVAIAPQSQAEYGVDLGGDSSLEAITKRWTALRNAQPKMFENFKPLIALKEGTKPGTMDIRLVAGPLPSSNDAAKLCAVLTAIGSGKTVCEPAPYEGHKLPAK